MNPEEIRLKQARELAHALGISLYISKDGRIAQRGPGKKIEPPPPHGRDLPLAPMEEG